jgi:two-component system, NtrC family, sensor histidine kinase HydH
MSFNKPMEILPETIKPFKLVKYFFLSSFIVVMIFALFLTWLITHRSKAALLKKTETFAVLLAENLNHQVFSNFILPIALQRKKVQTRNPDQFKQLDLIVRNTIHSFKVEKVNMYDPFNIIAYSTDRSLVGKEGLGGTDYKNAMKGKPSSRALSENSFWIWIYRISSVFGIRTGSDAPTSKLITTIPFRVEPVIKPTSQILGVFEITQDISKDYDEIIRDQYLMVFLSVGLMALLYMILLFIVKRGEVIMDRRAEEKKKLVEKLHQSERMAALGEMIASVSHEIKNPLGIIRSTADLLEKKIIQFDPQNQLASVIREEADRLNRIVTEFLDFARPQIPKVHPVQIETILEKNLYFLNPELERRQITVQKDFVALPATIQGDPDLLYRSFLNILLNAIQAMSEGGIIRVKVRHNPGGVSIDIWDSGPGLSEEELAKAFEPFFTTKEKGSGLGLAIVKNIVEAHKGTLRMVSLETGGVSVLIELPKGEIRNTKG